MDLNIMMREQARGALQTALDAAVTNGDTAAATKIADDIAKLAVSTAPKAPPYGQDEIKAELNKQPWFGTDPRRSAKAVELGKSMDLGKFASAAAFAEALVKAVDAEFAPAAAAGASDEDAEPPASDEDAEPPASERKPRRSDGPGESDLPRGSSARSKGPWTKLGDAPADIQKEVNRTADKFAPKTKEGREAFVTRALESHYAIHQRKAGKK